MHIWLLLRSEGAAIDIMSLIAYQPQFLNGTEMISSYDHIRAVTNQMLDHSDV